MLHLHATSPLSFDRCACHRLAIVHLWFQQLRLCCVDRTHCLDHRMHFAGSVHASVLQRMLAVHAPGRTDTRGRACACEHSRTCMGWRSAICLCIIPCQYRRAGRRVTWPADLRSTAASSTDAVLEIVELIIMWVLTTVREIRKKTYQHRRPANHAAGATQQETSPRK